MLQWLVEHQWRIQRLQQVQRHLPEKTPNNGFLPITHTTEDAIEGLHKSSPLHLIWHLTMAHRQILSDNMRVILPMQVRDNYL